MDRLLTDYELADREDRLAILPDWLQEGKTVWYWRECYCMDGDLCPVSVTKECPFNQWQRPDNEEIFECARRHPQLDSMQVWSVLAIFERGGVKWVVNDCIEVKDRNLRGAVFPTKGLALDHVPEVIEYG